MTPNAAAALTATRLDELADALDDEAGATLGDLPAGWLGTLDTVRDAADLARLVALLHPDAIAVARELADLGDPPGGLFPTMTRAGTVAVHDAAGKWRATISRNPTGGWAPTAGPDPKALRIAAAPTLRDALTMLAQVAAS